MPCEPSLLPGRRPRAFSPRTDPPAPGPRLASIDGSAGAPQPVTLPDQPVKGASQQEILAGFIRAGRGPAVNYQVAQEPVKDDKGNPTPVPDANGKPTVDSSPRCCEPIRMPITSRAERSGFCWPLRAWYCPCANPTARRAGIPTERSINTSADA